MADNLETVTCPACGETMEKIFIEDAGVNIDICTKGCGGIYFDNREMEKFDEKNEDIIKILNEIKGKTFKKVSDKKRQCPICGAYMVKNHTSVLKEVLIDVCYYCGGKFLDYGELTKVRSEYDTEEERSEEASRFFEALYCDTAKELAIKSENAHKNRSFTKQSFDKVFNILRAMGSDNDKLSDKARIYAEEHDK